MDDEKPRGNVREALGKRITWVAAFFLFIYMGIEVGVGGWIVTFMLDIRHGGNFASGMVATGYLPPFPILQALTSDLPVKSAQAAKYNVVSCSYLISFSSSSSGSGS